MVANSKVSRMRAKFARFAVVGVLAAAVFAAVAGAASASYSYSRGDSVAAWWQPGVYAFQIPNYTSVRMLCWTDGVWWNGNYWSNRWFRVSMIYGDGREWLHSSNVYAQTSVPHC
jgi:hypothetical protein